MVLGADLNKSRGTEGLGKGFPLPFFWVRGTAMAHGARYRVTGPWMERPHEMAAMQGFRALHPLP